MAPQLSPTWQEPLAEELSGYDFSEGETKQLAQFCYAMQVQIVRFCYRHGLSVRDGCKRFPACRYDARQQWLF